MPLNKLPSVMVVEDHDALRTATIKVLQQAGFDVVGVSCAEDVDDAHLSQVFDGYVVDLNLPGEDGFSLALRLRRARPKAKIIMTTARTFLEDRVKGYEAGADIYMPKPVDPEELVAALTWLIARSRAEEGDQFLLRIDAKKHLLFGPACEVKLAASEVRVLLALAQAKDQTLERWQLMVQLNPYGDEISGDNLQVRVSQLRRKLALCGVEGESIKAQRGVGYKLCVPLVAL